MSGSVPVIAHLVGLTCSPAHSEYSCTFSICISMSLIVEVDIARSSAKAAELVWCIEEKCL